MSVAGILGGGTRTLSGNMNPSLTALVLCDLVGWASALSTSGRGLRAARSPFSSSL